MESATALSCGAAAAGSPMRQRGVLDFNAFYKAPDGATALLQQEPAVASTRLMESVFFAYRGFHPRLRAAATSLAESQR